MDQTFETDVMQDLWEASTPEMFDPSNLNLPPAGTTVLSNFAPNSARLTSAHGPVLNRFMRTLIARLPTIPRASPLRVWVIGHEDETGDPDRFLLLGLDRAQAVVRVLQPRLEAAINKLPAANRRSVEFLPDTAGPFKPIRSNVTPSGRAMNRRVELRIL